MRAKTYIHKDDCVYTCKPLRPIADAATSYRGSSYVLSQMQLRLIADAATSFRIGALL